MSTRTTGRGRATRRGTTARVSLVLTAALLALAVALPGSAAASATSKRSSLTNVTDVGADCLTGARKGGSHEGSVTFTPSAPGPGYFTLEIVVRHALPGTTYYLYSTNVSGGCVVATGYSLTTDGSGNYLEPGAFEYLGNASTTYWVELSTAGFTDSLATKAVTF